MSLLDGLLPPPGAPGVVRVGADRWRQAADRLHGVENELRTRSAVLTASWLGPARAAFDGQTGGVSSAMGSGPAAWLEQAMAATASTTPT